MEEHEHICIECGEVATIDRLYTRCRVCAGPKQLKRALIGKDNPKCQ